MVKNTPPEHHDGRDWGGIRAWAARIASELPQRKGRRSGLVGGADVGLDGGCYPASE